MQRKFKKWLVVTTVAGLVAGMAVPATMADEAPVDISTGQETPDTTTDSASTAPSVQATWDMITYYPLGEEGSNSYAILVESDGQTMLICVGHQADGLEAILTSIPYDRLDAMILASDSDQMAFLYELPDYYKVTHLYTMGDTESADVAASYGVDTTYGEFFTIGNKQILLYPDSYNNIGVMVYDASGAVFLADAMKEMTSLEGHVEIGYLDVLSINGETEPDQEVISLMDPKACILTGETPSPEFLATFYGTIAGNQKAMYTTSEGQNAYINNESGIFVSAPKADVTIESQKQLDKNAKEAASQPLFEAEETADTADNTEVMSDSGTTESMTEEAESEEATEAETEEEKVYAESAGTEATGAETAEPMEEPANITNTAQTESTQPETKEQTVQAETAQPSTQNAEETKPVSQSNSIDKEDAPSMSLEDLLPEVGQYAEYAIAGQRDTGTEADVQESTDAIEQVQPIEQTAQPEMTADVQQQVVMQPEVQPETQVAEQPVAETPSQTEQQPQAGTTSTGEIDAAYYARKNESGMSRIDVAVDVMNGKMGAGDERAQKIAALGYDFDEIQKVVSYYFTSEIPWYLIVTYDMNGEGDTIQDVFGWFDEPNLIDAPESKTGKVFTGWFTDKECKTPYTSNGAPQDNVYLYAGWANAK